MSTGITHSHFITDPPLRYTLFQLQHTAAGYEPQILTITMSSLSLNFTSESTNLAVSKLHNDRSNWSDYEPHIQKAMGLKGLWRHVEGKDVVPKPYRLVNDIPVLSDGTTPAMEEQIKARET